MLLEVSFEGGYLTLVTHHSAYFKRLFQSQSYVKLFLSVLISSKARNPNLVNIKNQIIIKESITLKI